MSGEPKPANASWWLWAVGGWEEERGRAGSVHHLGFHLKAHLQSCLGGCRFISENLGCVGLWHQRDHKSLWHEVAIKLIALPRTRKGLEALQLLPDLAR